MDVGPDPGPWRSVRQTAGPGAEPLKILHLINDLDEDGGAQRIVRDLATARAKEGAAVLTLRPSRGTTRDLPFPHCSLTPPRPKNLRMAFQLIRQSDVLHVHLFPMLYLAAALRKPKVFTEHNTWNRRRDRPWMRPLDRTVYKRYGLVACISEATQSALQRWLGSAAPETHVVHNGIRLESFSRPPRQAPSERIRLLMIGRFSDQKDQATLVRALTDLPDDVNLTLVGDGPTRTTVETLVAGLSLQERVTFIDAVAPEEVPRLYAEADLYVQSSRWEGFGLVVVEAMASGLPVLASDVPGLAEVVGDPFLRFPAGDASALAAKIRSVLDAPVEYTRCSRASVERATYFSFDKMVAAYDRCYDRVCGDRPIVCSPLR